MSALFLPRFFKGGTFSGINIGTTSPPPTEFPTAIADTAFLIRYTTTPVRTGSAALHTAVGLVGDLYVFATSSVLGATSVVWRLDDVVIRTDALSPFDFEGDVAGVPIKLRTLSTGQHVISALYYAGNTAITHVAATFSVTTVTAPVSWRPTTAYDALGAFATNSASTIEPDWDDWETLAGGRQIKYRRTYARAASQIVGDADWTATQQGLEGIIKTSTFPGNRSYLTHQVVMPMLRAGQTLAGAGVNPATNRAHWQRCADLCFQYGMHIPFPDGRPRVIFAIGWEANLNNTNYIWKYSSNETDFTLPDLFADSYDTLITTFKDRMQSIAGLQYRDTIEFGYGVVARRGTSTTGSTEHLLRGCPTLVNGVDVDCYPSYQNTAEVPWLSTWNQQQRLDGEWKAFAQQKLDATQGLQVIKQMCLDNGLDFGFGEWAGHHKIAGSSGEGSNDSPQYMQWMYDFMNHLAELGILGPCMYFQTNQNDDEHHYLNDTDFPQMKILFQKLYGTVGAHTVDQAPMQVTKDVRDEFAAKRYVNSNVARVATGYFMGWADQSRVNSNINYANELGLQGNYPKIWGIDLDTGFTATGVTVFAFPKKSTTLVGAMTSSSTTATLASATAFPATTAYWYGVIEEGTPNEERILVKARSGTGLSSITRGVNNTTAKSHAAGSTISCLPLMGEHARMGGVALATIHAGNPGTPDDGTYVWNSGLNECNFTNLTTPGHAVNTAWLSQLSDYADIVEALEALNCVVMMRVFHESNLNSWWWSEKNPTATTALFDTAHAQIRTYFNTTRGIHNILWVYGPFLQQGEVLGSTVPAYPGDDDFDMVGVSNYTTLTSGGAFPAAALTVSTDWTTLHMRRPFIWAELGPPIGNTTDLAAHLNALRGTTGQVIVGFMNWDGSFRPQLQTNWPSFWSDPVMLGRGE